jgi:ABC-type multidrug transport system fused ATPase/permease subunit
MKTYLRLLKYLSPYKGVIFVTWLLSLGVLGVQGISAWIAANFVEKILSSHSETAFSYSGLIPEYMDRITAKILSQSTPFGSLVTALCLLMASALLMSSFRMAKMYLFFRANQSILARVRIELFSHLTELDLSFSRRSRPGEISSLFIRDVDGLQAAIFNMADRIFMQPLRLLMAAILMLSLSFELGSLTIAFLIASSLTIHMMGDRIERLSKQLMEKAAILQGHLIEYLSSVILARNLGREAQDLRHFENACHNLAETDIRFSLTNAVAPEIVKNLFIMAGGILLFWGGYKVLATHSLPASVLLKMLFLMPILTYPIEALASLYLDARRSLASAKRVFAVLDENSSYREDPNAQEPGEVIENIKLENVAYVVENKMVLSDVSLEITRGSKVLIYGPSGAGKTTILSLIAGITPCTSGTIKINGIDIRKMKGSSWRKRLGIVSQEPILLNGSIKDNLLYANPAANDATLCRILDQVALLDDSALPKGLETQVGNRGEFLSGGERQRLTIARAVLNDPEVFLMDEPTSMVDTANKAKLKSVIKAVSGGRTLILVTHDPYLRDIADVLYRLDDGRITLEKKKTPGEEHSRNLLCY